MTEHKFPLHLFPRDGDYHSLVGNYDGHTCVWILDGKVVLEEEFE